MIDAIAREIDSLRALPLADRVCAYNQITKLLVSRLIDDLPPDPCLAPQLWPAADVTSNDYNPNHVASTELDLLEQSIRADGITMPVVVYPHDDVAEVVDGFHRRLVSTTRLGRVYLPCSEINAGRGERMASTVRHNRARGKHQVELMGELVKAMINLGWSDARIAESMGMPEEETLRLRQVVGVAQQLARPEYSLSWRGRDGADYPDE
jgi:ParB-like chromosome segregation protein Spo0J